MQDKFGEKSQGFQKSVNISKLEFFANQTFSCEKNLGVAAHAEDIHTICFFRLNAKTQDLGG